MADHRILIPFIFHFAAGVYGKDGRDLLLPLDEQFEIASRKGWSDDPDDPGGATMIDVTLATFAAYRRRRSMPSPTKTDLRGITFGEWEDILKTMFWDRMKADNVRSQAIANIIVDWIWASGPSAIRRIQTAVGVKADGIVGPLTLQAINEADAGTLFTNIRRMREIHYRQCRGAWKYLHGWLRRLNAIRPDGSFNFR